MNWNIILFKFIITSIYIHEHVQWGPLSSWRINKNMHNYIRNNKCDKYSTEKKLNLDIESDKLAILRTSVIDKWLTTMVFIDNKGIFLREK